MLDQGMTLAEIAPLLPIRTNDTVTALTLSPEANLALGQALERTKRILDEIGDMKDGQVDLDDRLRRVEKWMSRPWWRRLFRRPPWLD